MRSGQPARHDDGASRADRRRHPTFAPGHRSSAVSSGDARPPRHLDPDVVAEIDRRLADVEVTHAVRIPWAIDSGSRAWGFPSPDSDYDCRFIFLRSRDDYLSLWAARDVIETPLDATFDVNGWDLSKALTLIAKSNATALEWLRSPIVYTGDTTFRDRLLTFADQVVERGGVGRHYLHVARRQKSDGSSLKRFFYVLRPAAALRWLADHPECVIPPMDLPTLLSQSTASEAVQDAAADLIAAKSVTRELGAGTVPPVLAQFVADELERAERFDAMPLATSPGDARAAANTLFRDLLDS